MKGVLLDTHVLLWWLADDARLGARARDVIRDGRNLVYVSAVSAWEISIKKALGKLDAPDDLSATIGAERFIELPITIQHGELAGQLPPIHRDPFDRMLIAQAQVEGLTLVTTDPVAEKYGADIIAAG